VQRLETDILRMAADLISNKNLITSLDERDCAHHPTGGLSLDIEEADPPQFTTREDPGVPTRRHHAVSLGHTLTNLADSLMVPALQPFFDPPHSGPLRAHIALLTAVQIFDLGVSSTVKNRRAAAEQETFMDGAPINNGSEQTIHPLSSARSSSLRVLPLAADSACRFKQWDACARLAAECLQRASEMESGLLLGGEVSKCRELALQTSQRSQTGSRVKKINARSVQTEESSVHLGEMLIAQLELFRMGLQEGKKHSSRRPGQAQP
jgi:hypothetical protein